jgi:hypothetical protein
MLDLQTISDRLEIQQLHIDYSAAIDSKNWDALDRIFTPDAQIDYSAMGGIKADYPTMKAWLAEALKKFPHYYHLVSNLQLTIDGDTAKSRIVCFNPMVMQLEAGQKMTMFFGLWYLDELRRTAAGWRITQRVEEKCFDYGIPAGLNAGKD